MFKLRILLLKLLDLLVQLFHLSVLLRDPLSIRLILSDQVLHFAPLVAQLVIRNHALFQGILYLRLHFNLFQLLRLNRVLQFLVLRREHGYLLDLLL